MKKHYLLLFSIVISVVTCGCSRFQPPEGVKSVTVPMITTGYCRCGKCCGWKRTWYGRPVYASGPLKGKTKKVGLTASGTTAKPGTIAADTKLYPFGTIMYIEDYGFGRVEDRGGGIKGNHIDLFFSSHKQAMHWGKKTVNVKVWRMPHK